ncbi:MAG TPA: hypothetical protein VFU23_01855 [Gemmatimonadales bacterium]|nr:hypothetical protein [Gemmatimonadales bacterium]
MNEHPNAAIIRSAHEAMGKVDVPAFAALLDDITWHESTPGFEGDYHGRDEVLALLGKVFQEVSSRKSCGRVGGSSWPRRVRHAGRGV